MSPNEAWHPTGSRFHAQAPLSHLEAESHWISVGHEQCLILREEGATRHERCQQVWQLPALSVRSENRTKRLPGVDRACCWWKRTHRPKKLKTYKEFQLSGALLPSIWLNQVCAPATSTLAADQGSPDSCKLMHHLHSYSIISLNDSGIHYGKKLEENTAITNALSCAGATHLWPSKNTTALAHFLTNFVLQHPFDSSPNNQQRGKWTQSSSLDLTYSVSLHKLRTPRSWTVWIHLSQQVAWSLVMEPVAASVTCSWTLSIWRFDKTVAFTMVSRELGDLSMLHYIVIIN